MKSRRYALQASSTKVIELTWHHAEPLAQICNVRNLHTCSKPDHMRVPRFQFDPSVSTLTQPKEELAVRPKSLAHLRMQLKAEREAENRNRALKGSGETRGTVAPAASGHLKELTRLMEGARAEAGKNFSQLLQKLENIKQASIVLKVLYTSKRFLF